MAAWIGNVTVYQVYPFAWLDCKLVFFLVNFSSQWSSCLLAVMCIEKFLAFYFPLKSRSISTVAMAKRVTFVITLILAGFNMKHFFIWEARIAPNGTKYCAVNIPAHYILILLKINYALYSFAPFTIMVLTNGAIIYKFMQALCARDQGGTE